MGILTEIAFLVEAIADTVPTHSSDGIGLRQCINAIIEVRFVELELALSLLSARRCAHQQCSARQCRHAYLFTQ